MREKENPKMVGLKRISTVVGLLAVTASVALAQGTAANPNQMTADSVANALRASRTLSGSRIEIEAQDGLVSLTGMLSSPALKAEAVARAQRVPGVQGVVDRLQVVDRTVQVAQYQPQVAMNLHGGMGSGAMMPGNMGGAVAPGTSGGFVNDGGPMPEGPAGGSAGAGAGGMRGAPNYAWPSYAPYPNFSAVGYPTAYPWQAWPNIGPFYPYPEVPLDWRAVTLRWDDGIWWLDFKKHYTRPFFIPYPFGIGAY
jgi:BON domain